MKLYSAKIDDIAKPVAEEPVKEVKEKKPRTEKQIAALEKAKEARKRKREEIDAKKEEIKEKEKEIDEAVEQAVAKKIGKQEATPSVTSEEEAPVKKSRKQSNPKKVPQKPEVDAVATAPGSAVERSNVNEDVHEPPAWFKTFIANTRAEEAKLSKPKKPRKQVRKEAEEMAQHKWQDSHTRDRVQTQADNHMRQMHQLYGQIFRR